MCSIKDAERQEALALLYQQEKNMRKAREHFLEAASIYVLQAELSKNESLIQKANACYAQSLGKNIPTTFSKKELAQRTLTELQEFQTMHHHDKNVATATFLACQKWRQSIFVHHDVLHEIREMI